MGTIKRVVVVFVSTESEALFSIGYKKSHPHYTVKILAQSIGAQTTLKENNIESRDLYDLVYSNTSDYYNLRLRNHYHKGHTWTKYFIYNFPKIIVKGVNLIPILQMLIEAEFIEIVFAQQLYKDIVKAWRPELFLFPKNKIQKTASWVPASFAAAELIGQYFSPLSQTKYFEVESVHKDNSHFISNLKNLPKPTLSLLHGFLAKTFSPIGKKTQTPPADFLLFSAGINLYFYNEVFKILKEKKAEISPAVFSDQNLLEHESLLRTSSIDYQLLNSLEVPEITGEISQEIDEFKGKLARIFKNAHLPKKVFPTDMSDSLKTALLAKVRLALETHGPKCIRKTILASYAIDAVKPKLVVTTHDPGPSALSFVYQAKKRHLPTLSLLHGLHEVSFGADHESDVLAAWGREFKINFAKILHKDPKTIHTVGYPLLDTFFKQKKAFWQKKMTQYAYHSPVRLSLLITVYQLDTVAINSFLIDLFAALSKKSLAIELHIRTHLSQSLVGIEKLAKDADVRICLNERVNIEEFCKRSDIIISWDTTAILWAMLFGKPLFYTTPWWQTSYIPAIKYKAAWPARNAQDLVRQIARIINNPLKVKELHKGQIKFLNAILGVVDGSSSERHIKLFEKLIA